MKTLGQLIAKAQGAVKVHVGCGPVAAVRDATGC